MARRIGARRLLAVCAAAAAAFVLPGRAAADDGLDPLDLVAAAAGVELSAPADATPPPTISAATAQVAAAAQVAAEGPQQPSPDVEAGSVPAVSDAISLADPEVPVPKSPASPPPAPASDVLPAADVPPLDPTPDPAASAPPVQAPAQPVDPAVPTVEPTATPATPPASTEAPPLPSAPVTGTTTPPPAPDPAPASQYQDGNTGSINSPSPSAPNSGLAWNWNWNWNCSDPSTGTSSITPSNLPDDVWTWNWNWACDTAAPPIPACSGCNLAVSIRILSPGDDRDLTQSIVGTAQSIAKNVNDTVQQATQTVVQPPAIVQTPVFPPLPLVEPVLTSMPVGAAETAAAAFALALPTLLTAPGPATRAESTRGIDAIPPVPSNKADWSTPAVVFTKPRTGFFSPLPPAAPTPERTPARAAAPPQANPTRRHTTNHVPLRLPRDPFAPPASLSVAPAASGPGSTGGVGLAILVGALLAASPQTARWLRTVRERRHPAPVSRRPERPG